MQDSQSSTPDPAPDAYTPEPRFTVADGFRFGCGFSLALFGAIFVVTIVVTLIVLFAMMTGMPLPISGGR